MSANPLGRGRASSVASDRSQTVFSGEMRPPSTRTTGQGMDSNIRSRSKSPERKYTVIVGKITGVIARRAGPKGAVETVVTLEDAVTVHDALKGCRPTQSLNYVSVVQATYPVLNNTPQAKALQVIWPADITQECRVNEYFVAVGYENGGGYIGEFRITRSFRPSPSEAKRSPCYDALGNSMSQFLEQHQLCRFRVQVAPRRQSSRIRKREEPVRDRSASPR